jgi:hypothetical protein
VGVSVMTCDSFRDGHEELPMPLRGVKQASARVSRFPDGGISVELFETVH